MVLVLAAAVAATLQAADVPLPRPRPAIPEAPQVAVETPHGPPTDCDRQLSDVAVFVLKPNVAGPGQCGAQDLLSLTAIRLADGKQVAVQPPATLRCEMAESLASWVRGEVAPKLASIGGGLVTLQQDDAYECRLRNRAVNGKVSEHAHGLAIDLHALVLADKTVVAPTDVNQPKDLRAALRESACRRFTTVLGPGEPAHDSHIHLDILQRRGGYRICSWDVREPNVAKAAARNETTGAAVPLPPPRPQRSTAAVR
jgi:hypothetical protein